MSELREARVKLGMTTKSMAEKIGMTPIKYNNIERGMVPPNKADMQAIRDVLGPVKFFTEEEIASLEKEFSDYMESVGSARQAIIADSGGKRSVSGSVVCPKCSQTLRYSVAFNGHVHASCTTQGCLSWME